MSLRGTENGALFAGPPERITALLVLASTACLFTGQCGGEDEVTYDQSCQVVCAPPASGPCAGQDPGACRQACVAATRGLSAGCASCLIGRSGWSGTSCTTYGASGYLCRFGPTPLPCTGQPGSGCTAAQETCTGLSMAQTSDTQCAAPCR